MVTGRQVREKVMGIRITSSSHIGKRGGLVDLIRDSVECGEDDRFCMSSVGVDERTC